MAEQKESSVLFSLKELMNLEEDRIKPRGRREEAASGGRSAGPGRGRASRARPRGSSASQAEEERRRSEEQRKKEEAARLEAIRHGEIEKARVEAEQRARMEAMSKQQEHERHLSTLQHDEHKKKLQRMVTFSIAGAAILLIGGLGLYFGKIKPRSEARDAARVRRSWQQAEEAEAVAAPARRADAEGQRSRLAQLSSAQDDKTRAELKAKLAEAQKAQQGPTRAAAGGGSNGRRRCSRPPRRPATASRAIRFAPACKRASSGHVAQPIVFPLDYPSLAEARAGAAKVRGASACSRSGLELFVKEGPPPPWRLRRSAALTSSPISSSTTSPKRWSERSRRSPRPARASSPCTPRGARRCSRVRSSVRSARRADA